MLVLDANILIRAVLGSRVLSLLRQYTDRVEFVAPEIAFQEAREWLPEIWNGGDCRPLPHLRLST